MKDIKELIPTPKQKAQELAKEFSNTKDLIRSIDLVVSELQKGDAVNWKRIKWWCMVKKELED